MDRFSFIEPKVLNNILYKNVLWANPRNIDIGFGTSNVFANVSMTYLSNSEPLSLAVSLNRRNFYAIIC